jgi:glutathione peroxidase
MRLLIATVFFCLTVASAFADQTAGGFYAFKVKNIDKQEVELAEYAGKVALVVNTASRCGFTSQYESLEKIYREYKDRGLVVLGFPSNDYLSQEPGSDEEIKKFCKLNYDVSFPMFSKAPVSGKEKQPVYRYLTEESASEFQGDPGWNFVKFLVSRDGKVIGRFTSRQRPDSSEVITAIEKALQRE